MKSLLKFLSVAAGIVLGLAAIYYTIELSFKNNKKYFEPWDYEF